MEEVLPEINDVPGSARLMKVMAKQATNKVSTIKLPDGKHTRTGKETLKELFRVHFPDSKLMIRVMEGASRTWTHVNTMNRGDWNLAKHVINE
jgi:predicted Mrr-cat superfamily restriction endonuclease